MRWIERMRMRKEMAVHRGRESSRLEAELQFHLDQQIAENVAAGMAPDEARAAALRSFGNPTLLREQAREAWSWTWAERLLRDGRIGIRTLLRTPGFSLTAILVMALCLGATTSLFTVTRAVLLKPLPFPGSEQLVMVYEHFRSYGNGFGNEFNVVAPADYADWRAQTHGFDDMAAWRWAQFNLSGDAAELPEVVTAAAGSWNLFSVLRVRPALGRTFTEAEDQVGANRVAMLTWSLFERRYGGNPSVIGSQIHLDGNLYTIVGVLPRWFSYPAATVQVWVPFKSALPPEILTHHDFHFARVVARLKPGVSLANAMSQVEAIQQREHRAYLNAPVAEDAISRSMLDDVVTDVRKPLVLLLCAAGCMLLIGCLNVANLLVARAAARQKETAIRGALGAGRSTLIGHALLESLLICAVGGAIGYALSFAATQWLVHSWQDLPRAESIHADGVVLASSFALVLVVAVVAGLLPALFSTRRNTLTVLQDSSRAVQGSQTHAKVRRALLMVEIAATVVLLIGAGLLFKSFIRMRTTDVGASTNKILTLHYDLPQKQYDTPAKVVSFNEALLDRVRQLPGIKSAGLTNIVPGAGYGGDDVFTVPEHPPLDPGKPMPDALERMADPDFFRTMGIPLVQGRFFTAQDRLDRAKYVIVSRGLAEEYFPHENPIGKHLVTQWESPERQTYEIVGVVADTLWEPNQPAKPAMYFPVFTGALDRDYTLAIQTQSDPLACSLPVQKVLAQLDPTLPVSHVLTMDQVMGEAAQTSSFIATLVLAFGTLSILLAAVGLFGVLSYLVTQRTSEIGVRMALGAQREQVMRLLLFDGMRPALFGIVVGLIASAGATRLIQSLLFGTRPLDPTVFAVVTATLLAVAALACLLPAWRAARLDPMRALRTE
ncbi:MAG TPA: ABC transporter permease [Acidobacteriaceae bacterium]|nr:ABC transporter permease [Acidobacteriaceae bacterium]